MEFLNSAINPLLPVGYTVDSLLKSIQEDEATKLAKEAFVTGHTGTTKLEIFYVLAATAACYLSSSILANLSMHLQNRANVKQISDDVDTVDGANVNNNDPHFISQFVCKLFSLFVTLFSFFLIPLSCLSSLVFVAFNPYLITLHLWITAIGLICISFVAVPFTKPITPQRYVPAITRVRGSLLLLTAISILAVDFNVFPREFAKTETFGVSIMDIGVGGFMFINALTSNLARISPLSVKASLRRTIFSLFPLLCIGFIRMIAHIGVNYQHHVSEYGVHWNYFFTLAGVLCLSDLLLSFFKITILKKYQSITQYMATRAAENAKNATTITPASASASAPATSVSVSRYAQDYAKKMIQVMGINTTRATFASVILGIIIISFYQYILVVDSDITQALFNHPTITNYIFFADRVSVISANKEGIVSVLGYLALTLLSIPIGRIVSSYSAILSSKSTTREKRIKASCIYFFILSSIAVASFCLVLFIEENIQEISRRLCNAPFVFWILSLSSGLLAAAILPDITIDIYTKLILSVIDPESVIEKSSAIKQQVTELESESGSSPESNLDPLKDQKSNDDNNNVNTYSMLSLAYTIPNSNPLIYFLITNLLTGFVNLTTRTLETADEDAILILAAYTILSLCVTTIVGKFLQKRTVMRKNNNRMILRRNKIKA